MMERPKIEEALAAAQQELVEQMRQRAEAETAVRRLEGAIIAYRQILGDPPSTGWPWFATLTLADQPNRKARRAMRKRGLLERNGARPEPAPEGEEARA